VSRRSHVDDVSLAGSFEAAERYQAISPSRRQFEDCSGSQPRSCLRQRDERDETLQTPPKLGNTYTENVVGALHAMREAEQLMTQTSTWMEENFEHWRVQWNGRLVRSIWARAQPLMHGRKDCTKCGAELTGRTVFHMSESVTCKHCGAVNAVSPDPLVYTYFAMAPDMIADEATIATKLGLERARSSGASQAQMIELTRQHWRAYATARAQIAPMSAEEQDRFVESRVSYQRQWG
jgi:hypothetical protein